jgi:uncharacterized LabA/DUF88 family protein
MRRRGKQPNNYAFIDSQNLNLGTQKMGWKMDWRKFREFLQQEYGITHAYMFIGYLAENESMYEYLHEMGYLLVLKPTLEIKVVETPEGQPEKETPKPPTKGNVDADLVLYAMKELPHYQKAIIVSGDGDFYGLIEYLAQQKKLLKVLAPNWQYSSLLKPFESYIVRLDQLRKQLSYHDRRKK